ncbi:MFS transporter [Streptomyces griseoflavus]|uniref:MFS transporter n=1 Tax=Streptomyces griseoflavus TaxID=35619 RepID=UPI003808943A
MNGPTALAPLTGSGFRRLWGGQLCALLADGAFTTALIWLALQQGGAVGVSTVVTARLVPRLVLVVLGGVLADRFRHSVVLGATGLAQGVAVAVLAVLTALGDAPVWQLAVLGAVAGAAGAPFFPALNAAVPESVPAAQLPAANALIVVGRLLGLQFVGPAAGGLLVGLAGAWPAFSAIAVVYALSGLVLFRLPSAPVGDRVAARELGGALTEGLRYVRATPWLLSLLLCFAAVNLLIAGPAVTLVPTLVESEFQGSATTLGLMLAAYGLGGGVAAMGIARVVPDDNDQALRRLYGAFVCAGLSLGALGLIDLLPLAMILYALAGAAGEYGNVVWITVMQRRVPGRLIGRISSLDWFLSLSLVPLSTALSGTVAENLGAGTVLVWCGGLCAGLLALALLVAPRTPGPSRDAGDGPGVQDANPDVNAGASATDRSG